VRALGSPSVLPPSDEARLSERGPQGYSVWPLCTYARNVGAVCLVGFYSTPLRLSRLTVLSVPRRSQLGSASSVPSSASPYAPPVAPAPLPVRQPLPPAYSTAPPPAFYPAPAAPSPPYSPATPYHPPSLHAAPPITYTPASIAASPPPRQQPPPATAQPQQPPEARCRPRRPTKGALRWAQCWSTNEAEHGHNAVHTAMYSQTFPGLPDGDGHAGVTAAQRTCATALGVGMHGSG
jgi:hypothetical protein